MERILEYARERFKRKKEEEPKLQRSPSIRYPWESSKLVAEKVAEQKAGPPIDILAYAAKKRRELMAQPVKAVVEPKVEIIRPPPPPVPCGGTCAAARAEVQEDFMKRMEKLGEKEEPKPQEWYETILPKTLSPSDIGREIGEKTGPVSWYEAEAQKVQEWSKQVAEKQAKRMEKLKSELPWDQAAQELPWQREEQAMKEHLAVVQDLKEIEKQLVEKKEVLKEGLPWEKPYSERVKQKVALATVVDGAKEELQRARWLKEKEAKEHGRQPDEDLNTDEEEILDKLLDAIADHYDTKYEPMREAIRKLALSASEKTYLGGQFQETYEADYDTLTPARKKDMVALAEQIWKNNKGNYYKASEELEGIRDSLKIDTVEFAAADEKLDEIDEAVKTERTTQLEKERKEMARRAATEYRVSGMTLNQLAERLIQEFKGTDEAEEQLEHFNLTEKEQDYLSGKLRDLESKRMDRIWTVLDEAAAEKNEGYGGLLRRIAESDELTESQKETMQEDVREDMGNYIQQEMDNLLDTTWAHKKHQVEKNRDIGELDEYAADEMIDMLESEEDEEKAMLEEAGLTGLSTLERLNKIDAAQIPANMKEQLEEMVHVIADREELAKQEVEKEKREEKFKKGEIHEKKPEGYTLHFKPK